MKTSFFSKASLFLGLLSITATFPVLASPHFVLIKGGTFFMGSPDTESGRYSRTETLHQVTLTQNFEMQTTEVTQAEWFEVMGYNPSQFASKDLCPQDYKEIAGTPLCANNPVESVSWNEAQDFIEKLNEQNSGYQYRLPTEAEWEYAARGGQQTAFSFGNNIQNLSDYGWYVGNSDDYAHAVATKKPNQYGLFDMHGNVFEWVQDIYSDLYYTESPSVDPQGPSTGIYRGLRGGSWYSYNTVARSATRLYQLPIEKRAYVGIRLVRTRAK